MKFYDFLSSRRLGLEFQSDQLRLVLLRKTRRRFFLERADTLSLPVTVLTEKKENSWQIISASLADYVKRYKLTGIATAISVPANYVMMQPMQVPSDLSHEAITSDISEKVQRDLRIMSDTLCIDYTIIQTLADSTKIFFAAMSKTSMASYVDCMHEAGLSLKIIDIDVFSFNRAVCLALSWDMDREANHGLLFVRNETAIFMVFQHQRILFYQTWDLSSGVDFLAQFENRVQQYHAVYSDQTLQRWIVSATHEYGELISKHYRTWQVETIDATTHTLFLSHAMSQSLQVVSADFFVACGAALQEFPLW
ncbi:MAG: pilus assembly protein PilM [Gammaproteobacteria bacterium]|nr:pilus assembly protein PilM [Gammaproteobacteria bacterium]